VYRACESIAHDRSVQCIGRRQRGHILQELLVKERLLQSQTHPKHTQSVAEKVNAAGMQENHRQLANHDRVLLNRERVLAHAAEKRLRAEFRLCWPWLDRVSITPRRRVDLVVTLCARVESTTARRLQCENIEIPVPVRAPRCGVIFEPHLLERSVVRACVRQRRVCERVSVFAVHVNTCSFEHSRVRHTTRSSDLARLESALADSRTRRHTHTLTVTRCTRART